MGIKEFDEYNDPSVVLYHHQERTTTTDMWKDFNTSDEQKKCASYLKGAFSMLFFGILSNVAQIGAFLVECLPAHLQQQVMDELGQPKALGRLVAGGTGAAMFLFYMIGFALAVDGPKDLLKAVYLDSDAVYATGASVALWIVAWLGAAGTMVLAFLWTLDSTGRGFVDIPGLHSIDWCQSEIRYAEPNLSFERRR